MRFVKPPKSINPLSLLLLPLGLNLFSLAIDYTSFWVKDSFNFLEFYYSLPYSSIPLAIKGDTLIGSFSLYFQIEGVISDSMRKILYAPRDIPIKHLSVLDGFGFLLKRGKYPFKLSLSSPDGKMSLFVIDTILSPDFQNSLSLSPLVFATYLGPDSLKGRFYRNGFYFNPNPSRSFSLGLASVYLEVYNLTKGSPYEITYSIKEREGERGWVLATKRDTARETNFVIPFSFSTAGLTKGHYTLSVSVLDLKTNQEASAAKEFSVQREEEPQTEPSAGDWEEVFFLLASEREKERYKNFSAEEKVSYLKNYFRRVNYFETKKRLNYIDEKLGKNKRNTPQAKVILKYGIPDEIESHTFKENVRPHEHWYYHNKNYHFIFMNIRDVGEPVLLWSNVPGERNYPGWERFVDPDEYEALR